MEEHEIPQMIISDPVAIFYLTGKWIFPGERLLALYLNVNGNHKMMINKLFPQESDLGVDIIYYDDIEDGVEILSKYVEKDKTMGIDKTWPSKFLIRLQELGGGSKFVNGSPIIDYIRMVKDEKEQDLMRKSSKINDIAMDKIIPWVAKGLTEKELNAKMREIYKELGCEDVSFDPITAYGHGAADPHHVTDDSKGKRGDCVILDIGGFKDNYASDMTRTVFIGEVSDRAREVYNVVLEANLRGIAAAKPGNRMCDVDLAARNYIEEKGFGRYFFHDLKVVPQCRCYNLLMGCEIFIVESTAVSKTISVFIKGKSWDKHKAWSCDSVFFFSCWLKDTKCSGNTVR